MNTTNLWRIAAILLAACTVVLTYRIFDQGITRTYLEASMETSDKHIQLMTGLVEYEWRGLTETQVMQRLKLYVASQAPGSIVLERESGSDSIYLEGIRFEFHEGILVKIY